MYRKLIGITLLLLILQILHISCYSTMVKPEIQQRNNDYWKQQFHKDQLVKILTTDNIWTKMVVTDVGNDSVTGTFDETNYTINYNEILKVKSYRDKVAKTGVSALIIGLFLFFYLLGKSCDGNCSLAG